MATGGLAASARALPPRALAVEKLPLLQLPSRSRASSWTAAPAAEGAETTSPAVAAPARRGRSLSPPLSRPRSSSCILAPDDEYTEWIWPCRRLLLRDIAGAGSRAQAATLRLRALLLALGEWAPEKHREHKSKSQSWHLCE